MIRRITRGKSVLWIFSLLIPILAWVCWMHLIEPRLVEARYEAEVMPSLITAFWDNLERYDTGHFPGVGYSEGRVRTDDEAGHFYRNGVATNYGTTRLCNNSGRVQTFRSTSEPDLHDAAIYEPVISDADVAFANCDVVGHVIESRGGRLDTLLRGRHLCPQHVQYVSGCAGHGGGDYWVAYGAFGNGDGLPAGTGWAELQFYNTSLQERRRLRWSRWQPMPGGREQILFAIGDEYKGNPHAPNRCYIPPTRDLMSEDRAVFEKAIATLYEVGWE